MTDHRQHLCIAIGPDTRCQRCGKETAAKADRYDDCPGRWSLSEHLAKPCDQEGCDRTATHNGIQRGSAGLKHGRWCNAHTSWDHPAFARND